ncbi:hypothetical protein BU24DRAFT_425066 [Aaosphaeria arxii CBS 175.79]|uniref:GPI anchored protein n=1 Tax=Aaosphaeria arxii CBS 175.79 TaxID=1450172 RepID=A0A6A5XLC1_9PLEO|nr:uncharacterized protein BU24DRAFT_425066 [Aaosphaeria arxii CBS 175.79]KAF2014065.1 hypothetical protein BU24DRAFT_425066 [Aaosphaeria arxii CBS 175.79]
MYSTLVSTLAIFATCAFSSPLLDSSVLSTTTHGTLKASKRHRDLIERGTEVLVTHGIELVYAADHLRGPVFASQIHLQSDQDVVFLEEYDHLLDEVHCNESIMQVKLKRHGGCYDRASEAWSGLQSGLLVSSHETCSENGAHAVYKILSVEINDDTATIEFQLEETVIEKEFHSATIEFGHSNDAYVVHNHGRLSRRQNASPTVTELTASGTATQTEDATATADLGFSQVDTVFLEGTNLNPIGLGCKNCTGKGEMIITTGKLEINLLNMVTGEDNDPIESGFVQFDVPNFEMSLLFSAIPSITFPLGDFIPIPNFLIPGTGFTIPNIATFGAFVDLNVSLEVGLSGGVELGFGFDVKVPTSAIRLDIAELRNSSITGFTDTEITAKPIQANASDIELGMKVGFRPTLKAGFEIRNAFNFTAGPYFSLPEFNIAVAQLASSGVGANCEEKGETVEDFTKAFQNLTHVEYSLDLAAGIQGPQGFEFELTRTPIVAATQCLAYQQEGTSTGLAVATEVLESMKASASATATGTIVSTKGSSVASSISMGPWERFGVFGLMSSGVATALLAILL